MTNGKAPAAAMINSKKELDAALSELCGLMDSQSPSASEKRRMELLVDAVEAYEHTYYPIPDPSDAALLAHLLDAKGGSVQQLSQDAKIPVRSLRSILTGEKKIGSKEAAAFAKFFSVEQSVFKPKGDVSITGFSVASIPAGERLHAYFRVSCRASSEWTTMEMPAQAGVMAGHYFAHRQLDRSQARPVALRS